MPRQSLHPNQTVDVKRCRHVLSLKKEQEVLSNAVPQMTTRAGHPMQWLMAAVFPECISAFPVKCCPLRGRGYCKLSTRAVLHGWFFSPHREWYVNGDYLVLMVSLVIILPLSMLRNLGRRRGPRAKQTAASAALTSFVFLRLPRLHQRAVPALHGLLPDRGERRASWFGAGIPAMGESGSNLGLRF